MNLSSSNVVTNRDGNFYEQIEYFPYGEKWVHNKSSEEMTGVPYKFTSKELDAETEWYYFGARYYDARLGRWTTVDPPLIRGEYLPKPSDFDSEHDMYWYTLNDKTNKLPGMGGVFNPVNLNAYQYAGNNPVVLVDPDGNAIFENAPPSYPLKTAQNMVINKPEYKRGAGGPFNLPGPKKTWCNQAVFDIAEMTGLPVSKLTTNENRWNTNANELVWALRINWAKGKLQRVTGKKAQELANKGFTVIAAWENISGGSGHVATVAKDKNDYDESRGPLLGNVGASNGIKYTSEAFGKDKMNQIEYYYDPKQDRNYLDER